MSKLYEIIVAGRKRRTAEVKEVRFPYNDEVVAEVCQAGEADLEEAVAASVRGFEATRKLPVHQRTAILGKLRELIGEHRLELADAVHKETGKPYSMAMVEVGRAMEVIRASGSEAQLIGGEIVPMDWTPAGEGRLGIIRRFPLGPVLAITPFNYPLNLACHKIGPAMAAGNSIILKPATATPISALILGELLLEAGYPAEAVSVVACPGARLERLVGDDRIAFLSFTGSSQVGWHLKSIAGRKKVGLELGGNAAVIVHDDADIGYAVGRIVMGGYTNSGQNCIHVQRVLVQSRVYEETVARIVEKVREIKFGDPGLEATEVGPMIDAAAASKAMDMVAEAVAQGAAVLVGGQCRGTMFEPTVLAGTTPEMRVNREEIFGPVITVSPYETWDEAIARANDTEYGLQAGIFTQNISRIMRAFEEIQVGGLQVNDVSTFRMDHMPYGGVKASGVGKEGPKYLIEEMTEPRLMVLNMPGAGE